ncbi:MAG: DoxX family membrane protein [Phycisphaerales bacterium]|nr:DoxX family membrane protein [Phycisphaerales bacterium]
MRLRDSIALTLPSFFLRLVLGITFIWAGTGKLMGTMQVSGDDAARLANLGIDLNVIEAAPAPTETDTDELIEPLPQDPPVTTDPSPADPDTENPDLEDPNLENQASEIIERLNNAVDNPPANTTPPAETPEQPTSDDPDANTPPNTSGNTIGRAITQGTRWTRVQNTTADRSASDFPEPVECQRVYSIALMISKAADPGLTADSQPITPIMPAKLANRPWPKVLAWCAAITELVAGGFLILGLLTRLSAFSTFFVMLVAMWMTQFGPAALHTNDAILGFIPRADDLFSPVAYGQLFWQLALATMSLAVVFLGSGAIGLDRLFFSPHSRDPYLHGDPKAAPKGQRKAPMNPATAQRSEFDRSPAES